MRVLEADERLGGGTRSSELTVPGPGARRMLRRAPACGRLAVRAALRPGGTRADLAVAGGPVLAPARGWRRGGGLPIRGTDGGRARQRRPPLGRALRAGQQELLRPRGGLPAADPARPLPSREARALRHAFRAPGGRPGALLRDGGGPRAVGRRGRTCLPAVRRTHVIGGRGDPRKRRTSPRVARRRRRLGVDQSRHDLAARGTRRAPRDGCRGEVPRRAREARHRDARRGAGGRRAHRRGPDAAQGRASVHSLPAWPCGVQGRLRGGGWDPLAARALAPCRHRARGRHVRGDRSGRARRPPREDAGPAVRPPLPAVRRG